MLEALAGRLQRAQRVDWLLLGPVVYLTVLSVIVLRSLSIAADEPDFNLLTQIIAICLGFVAMVVVARMPLFLWQKLAGWLWVLAVGSLGLLLAVGSSLQGSQRWLTIGGWQFQPSELAKLALVVVSSVLLAYGMRKSGFLSQVRAVVASIAAGGIIIGLIILQPDLGTAVVCLVLLVTLLFLSNVLRRTIIVLSLATAGTLPFLLPRLAEYQQDRITTFFNPSLDPLGRGYNVIQATIAIGSGGIFGRGLDGGTQSLLNFLPAKHTDFIFAVIAEKLGFLGALTVIVALCLLVVRCYFIAWSSDSRFGRLLAVGIGTLFLTQAVINIGMNIGVAPVTGLPLPFVSFGGTHIGISFVMIGLLLAVQQKSGMARR